jgi:hypothetical protein
MREPIYDRRTVERLIPYLWDTSYAYRATDPYAPDPDMPRGQANPARSGNLWAGVADVRRAWSGASLTQFERQAIVCEYGLRWPVKLTAKKLDRVPSMIATTLYEGVGSMLDFLEPGR